VQEAFATTATADVADLLLPAATWGEKDGTVTNSERRISRVRAALPPAGQARADWRIVCDVGRRLEARLGARRADGGTLFPFAKAEAIWREHRETTRGRDLDISGLDWAALERPRQWPCPEGSTEGPARLYGDGRFATPDGRARFLAPAYRPVAQPRDARHPFALTTGRLRDQWHGMSRTGTLARLFAHDDAPAIELHPQDLARRGLQVGELVRIRSRQGEAVLPLRANDGVRPAQAFVAMHWGAEFVGGHGSDGQPLLGVNALTGAARCPQSRQPELKHTAVRIEPARLPWRLVAAAWLPASQALATREALRALLPRFGYASCLPFGREPDDRLGVLLRAASATPVDAALLQAIELALGLDDGSTLRYVDRRRGQHRALRLAGAETAAAHAAALQAVLLAGEGPTPDWVLALLQDGVPARPFGRALLSGRPEPPQPMPPRSAQVCNCLDVREDAIACTLEGCHGDDVARLSQLQARLGCGTRCGACLPRVRALVGARRPASAGAATEIAA
jgi:assimilatory nitrate reductase catalytic subunit